MAQIQVAKGIGRDALIKLLLDSGAGYIFEAEEIADFALDQETRRSSFDTAIKGAVIGLPLGFGSTAALIFLIWGLTQGFIWPWAILIAAIGTFLGWSALLAALWQLRSPALLLSGVKERIGEFFS